MDWICAMLKINRFASYSITALCLCVGLGAVPASAATVVEDPAATATSCAGISFTGITASACAGGFDKNLLKGTVQDPGLAALQALGYVGDGSYVQKLSELTGNSINFSSLLVGTTFVGIHYGQAGDAGGNATSFFRFDAGSGVDSFDFNRNGLSNAVLFQTGQMGAVPEPATWAMMLLGFGLVGGAMRSAKRRQKVTVFYA